MQYIIIALYYASILYLALPLLKQGEKGRVWNGSGIYATSHPSSATDYKIKECTPHICLYKLWNTRIEENHASVILIKSSFKWSQSLMYFEQENQILCVRQPILHTIKKNLKIILPASIYLKPFYFKTCDSCYVKLQQLSSM